MIKKLTTKQLQELLYIENVRLIDTRPVDAYNGWPMKNESAGGHIPNAKSLPHKWTHYMDWIEVVRHKDIAPHHSLVIYGYDEKEVAEVAELFVKGEYEDVYVYHEFIDEWIEGGLPLETLKRFDRLVYPQWLNSIINDGSSEGTTIERVVVVHAHYRNRDAYLSGHIPGAIDMDTLALESPETWNRRSPEELKLAFEHHGITANSTVVLYGKYMHPDNDSDFPGSAAGHLGAIRCAAIMLYAGVKDVRVLNGGFQSWKDAGLPISTNDVAKQAVLDFGVEIPQYPELFVDTDEAKEMLASDNADLVSVRSWPEFIGEVSGYNYIEKTGRIPGAIFGNCGTDAYHMENYRNVDHTVREAQEVEAIWQEVNIIPDKHLAFYCGTGWRGSEAFFNAWLMGWPRVSVYDGGWFEWSNNPNNPYEVGAPKLV
ncbi:rhodanese-like domain-containing protein [Carboxylicivirga sp. M1479]|uniref:rhodanese-like domain-containing protein n=1 Tax=Carboxylicivirga sp. M1479 TaxID=2594476 RepID=UPI0011786E7C|nr:rhodanese-like domain-containing protein [Carboxylicivirga sp. M1479]TRX71749.1 thiosulfate sulfurtransferase [Carboxylicivirga sp. M1479]